jgi:hypothetical protein
MTPSIRWRRSASAIALILYVVEIRRDFQRHRHVFAMFFSELFLPRLELREQIVQRIVLLQLAQILGIGRGNVDRDIAGVVVDLLQADQIIVGCIFDRGRGVLADIDAENAPFFRELSRPNVFQQLDQRRRC